MQLLKSQEIKALTIKLNLGRWLFSIVDIVMWHQLIFLISLSTTGIKWGVWSELVQGRAKWKRRLHPQELHRDESSPVSILHYMSFCCSPLTFLSSCSEISWAHEQQVFQVKYANCQQSLSRHFRQHLVKSLEDITSGPVLCARLALFLLMCLRPLMLNWILTLLHHCWRAVFVFSKGQVIV